MQNAECKVQSAELRKRQTDWSVFFDVYLFLFVKLKITYVNTNDITIISMSIGERTIYGRASNKKPSPKRYKLPDKRNISPIYMTSVVIAATAEGKTTDNGFFLPVKNEPV